VHLSVGPGHVGRRPGRFGGEEGGVPLPDPLEVTRPLESTGGVVPDRLQEGVPGGTVHLLHLQQRPVDQACHLVEHFEGVFRLVASHRCGAIESESPSEDAESHEQHPGGLGEEVVAPVDGRAEGAMPGRDVPSTRGEEGEDIVEAVPDLLHTEDPDPGRCELDGERDPLEPPADVGHDPDIVRSKREFPCPVPGPLLEEAHGPGPGHRLRWFVRVRYGETGYEPCPLPGHAQSLPAGGENRQLRTGAQEFLGHLRTGIHQVLAIVQDEEEWGLGDEWEGRRRVVSPDLFAHAQGTDDLLREECGVRERRELDPADGIPSGGPFCTSAPPCQDFKCQAGLPTSAGAGQGQKPRGGEEVEHLQYLVLPPDQGGEWYGDPAGRGRTIRHLGAAVDLACGSRKGTAGRVGSGCPESTGLLGLRQRVLSLT
jgi:hypothetical protein